MKRFPRDQMPPPTCATAAFRAIVEPITVTSASPEIAPPRSSARFPSSTESTIVTSPSSVKIAPPGPSAIAAVHGRPDDGDVPVLIGVERAPIAVGRVAVDVRAHDDDVAGRADRSPGAVHEVAVEDRVADEHTAAAGVHGAAVVVGEVAGEHRVDDRGTPHGKDGAARLLGQVLRHARAHDLDLAASGDRRPGAVAAAALKADVLEADEPGSVLAQDALLEARLAHRVTVAVDVDGQRRLPDRVAQEAGPEGDVTFELDVPRPRVGPRSPQFALRRHARGRRWRGHDRACAEARDQGAGADGQFPCKPMLHASTKVPHESARVGFPRGRRSCGRLPDLVVEAEDRQIHRDHDEPDHRCRRRRSSAARSATSAP